MGIIVPLMKNTTKEERVTIRTKMPRSLFLKLREIADKDMRTLNSLSLKIFTEFVNGRD